jgi:hypothetical protein
MWWWGALKKFSPFVFQILDHYFGYMSRKKRRILAPYIKKMETMKKFSFYGG